MPNQRREVVATPTARANYREGILVAGNTPLMNVVFIYLQGGSMGEHSIIYTAIYSRDDCPVIKIARRL